MAAKLFSMVVEHRQQIIDSAGFSGRGFLTKKADNWNLDAGRWAYCIPLISCFVQLWTLRAQFLKLWQHLLRTQVLAWLQVQIQVSPQSIFETNKPVSASSGLCLLEVPYVLFFFFFFNHVSYKRTLLSEQFIYKEQSTHEDLGPSLISFLFM